MLQKYVWHVVLETTSKRNDVLRYLHHVATFDNLSTEVEKLVQLLEEISLSLTSYQLFLALQSLIIVIRNRFHL